MITKLLTSWLKKNKVQLKTEVAGDRFFNAFCFESKTYNEKFALAELIEDGSSITIIGNIHENSELLEK